MRHYISREQQINRNILTHHESLKNIQGTSLRGIDEIIIFATGSSSNAAQGARIYMQEILQMPVTVKEPSMSKNYDYFWKNSSLYIAISQGGRSYSVIELVKKLKEEKIKNIVLTSDLSSPLAQVADNCIDLGMEVEEMPYVTAGYTAIILNLWLMTLSLANENSLLPVEKLKREYKKISDVIDLAPAVIKKTDYWYLSNKEKFMDKKRYVFIGYGATYGVALEAETKFSEILHLPTHGHELEEYMHGPYLALDAKDALFLIDSEGKLSGRMGLLRKFLDRHMDETFIVSQTKLDQPQDLCLEIDVSEYLVPLIMTIPFHLISYYLSEAYQYDLTTSYYPDFDKIVYSKI